MFEFDITNLSILAFSIFVMEIDITYRYVTISYLHIDVIKIDIDTATDVLERYQSSMYRSAYRSTRNRYRVQSVIKVLGILATLSTIEPRLRTRKYETLSPQTYKPCYCLAAWLVSAQRPHRPMCRRQSRCGTIETPYHPPSVLGERGLLVFLSKQTLNIVTHK